jgi:hypothetical protein
MNQLCSWAALSSLIIGEVSLPSPQAIREYERIRFLRWRLWSIIVEAAHEKTHKDTDNFLSRYAES